MTANGLDLLSLLFANREPSSSPVNAWINFYSIVGSSAGALTGLQFVVLTLVAQTKSTGSMREIRAFGTPTVVHFCVALLISGVMSAPWPALWQISVCLGICSACGFLYSFTVIWHAHKATYNPDLEDWFWYAGVPIAAHSALIVASLLLWSHSVLALFIVAAASLLFLFVGIHNSWDTVTYVAVKLRHNSDGEENQS